MKSRRRKHPLAAGVVVIMLIVGGAGLALAAGSAQSPSTDPERSSLPATTDDGPTAPVPLPRSKPVKLTIPSMGLDTRLITLDATPDGIMELPPVKRAGWYTGSVTPGEVGLTVIAGYIRRSNNAPGVVENLRLLRVGQQIVVARADGTSAGFEVTRIASYDKGAFPADEVYASGAGPELRLVTVGGALKDGDPLGNVVVFARFTGPVPHDAAAGPSGDATAGVETQ